MVNCKKNKDGEVLLREKLYEILAQREQTYWWHVSRRRLVSSLLKKHGLEPRCSVLDLGCGTGGNFSIYMDFKPRELVGLDISPIALAHARCRAPSATLTQADINQTLPFESSSFEVVSIFNVLYHDWIKDEKKILIEAVRLIRPGGFLVITEPAFMSLSREIDRLSMGRKRYKIEDLHRILAPLGLKVLTASYFASFAAMIVLGSRLLKKQSSTSESQASIDTKPIAPWLNSTLKLISGVEAFLIMRRFKIPFGVTLLCIFQK